MKRREPDLAMGMWHIRAAHIARGAAWDAGANRGSFAAGLGPVRRYVAVVPPTIGNELMQTAG